MEPDLMEKRTARKWKKDKWKSLPPLAIKSIKQARMCKLWYLGRKAVILGIHPIYSSDDNPYA
jgi:hypothetical protein